MDIKEDVKALRKALRLTQQELADELGVAMNTVSRWELGQKRPSKLALRQIARLEKRVRANG